MPRSAQPQRLCRRPLGLMLALGVMAWPAAGSAASPTAILHAHDQRYRDVAAMVCEIGAQGYSHIQIAPAQRSAGDLPWWQRYQPVDHRVIEGRGSAADLLALTRRAHGCGVKVIADVVLNHMASHPRYAQLRFPGLGPDDFHPRCGIDYADGNTISERRCWLNGDLPDLDPARPAVRAALQAHLKLLLDLGVDGFRFDAAKHMEPATLGSLISFANRAAGRPLWHYLEVIDDHDTRPDPYTAVAPVTDFVLCDSLAQAFAYSGHLSSLRVPRALPDRRSVSFAINHDSDPTINPGFPRCRHAERGDALLATAYVLAREAGTPLVLADDNRRAAYLPAGARFRAELAARAAAGRSTRERVLVLEAPQTLLLMERGSEGFFVVNKAAQPFDVAALALPDSSLEGCYRELRNGFTVAVQPRGGRRWLSRWGRWARGGLQVQARDALYFLRVPFAACR